MSYDKTTYINNISELFGSGIASIIGKESEKYPEYEIRIRKNGDEGSIIFERRFYNGNADMPSKISRIVYPVLETQLGFIIPEARIRKEEYKNGKLTKLKE